MEFLKIAFGEILGSFVLILLGNALVCNVVLNKAKGYKNSNGTTICAGGGLAVSFGIILSSSFSRAHLNPAVTLALGMFGDSGTFVGDNFAYVPFYILCQFIGMMLGQLIVVSVYYKHYQVTTESDAILATFSTKPSLLSYGLNLLVEIVATFILGLVILYLTFLEANPIYPAFIVGITVTSLLLSLGGTTGLAMNPARDLAPRIIHALFKIPNKGKSDGKYAAIPVFGPILGAMLSVGVMKLLALGEMFPFH